MDAFVDKLTTVSLEPTTAFAPAMLCGELVWARFAAGGFPDAQFVKAKAERRTG